MVFGWDECLPEDLSKEYYGFACYCRPVNAESVVTNLLFSKCRSAPIKPRGIPTLQLLAVYMAMKCLESILRCLRSQLQEIVVGVDAQVVLSWVLSGKVKAKNLFASNRVKEVTMMRKDIYTKFGVQCKFKFVPTEFNVADLTTKSVSSR